MTPIQIKWRSLAAIVFLFALPFSLSAQRAELDSLLTAAATSPADTQQVHRLLRISQLISNANQDSALLLAGQAVGLGRELGFANGEALGLNQLAFLFNYRREVERADSVLQLALTLEGQLAKYPATLARVYKNLGKVERYRGNLPEAEKLFFTALGFAEKQASGVEKAVIHNELGDIFDGQGNTEKGTEYRLMAIDFFKQKGNFQNVAIGYLNIALTLKDVEEYEKALGFAEKGLAHAGEVGNPMLSGWANRVTAHIQKNLGDLEPALEKAELAAEHFQALKNEYEYAKTVQFIGVIHHETGRFEMAANHFAKAKKILEKGSDQASLAWLLFNMSENETALGRTAAALQNAEAGLLIAEKIGDPHILLDGHGALEQAHLSAGNPAAAYEQLKMKTAIRDTIFEEEKRKALLQVEAEYQTKEQAAELALKDAKLSKQRTWIWGAGLFAILAAAFALFIWKNNREKQAANRLLTAQAAQLKLLDRAKSRFFTNISHELRTPLQLILAPLESAKDKTKNKGLRDDLDLAHRNGKKLLTLVNEIMDLSKLESGKMTLAARPVHLKPFLRRLLFSYHSLAQLRGFMLSFEYELGDDLWVELDKGKFEKIVNNLLSNAFKYSNPGGVITLKAVGSQGGAFSIEVVDQGKGISTAEMDKVFDRFYQVEGEDEPLQGGTGVGLALARELARLHSGDLTVKSEVGEGSRFILTVPMRKAVAQIEVENGEEVPSAAPETEATVAYQPILLNGKKPKILVTEDNPEMGRFLKKILSLHYDCTLATDGQEALELAQSTSFDLITSDVMMPNMDGFSFLKKLRNMRGYAQVPFVLLTARALQSDKLEGLRLGVDDYITKPFQTAELLARISNLLENKKRRDEWLTEQAVSAAPAPAEELSFDDQLLLKAEKKVMANLSNAGYSVEQLCADLNYSRRHTERLIKKLTGLSPVAFIREIRLQKAQELLHSRQYPTISEIAYEVGFESPGYFTRVFTRRFGKNPSEAVGG